MKFVLILGLALHGLFHLLGLKMEGTRLKSRLWIGTALLFFVSAVLVLEKSQIFLIPLFLGVFLSQALIFQTWQQAKFGTVPNLILLCVGVLGAGSYFFSSTYGRDVQALLERPEASAQPRTLKTQDWVGIPRAVRDYIAYAGFLEKPLPRSMRVQFEGRMRSKGKDFFSFSSEQWNAFEDPSRLFFMSARMFGLPILGYHRYRSARAEMDIRIGGLTRVAHFVGNELDVAETVTFFNDLCLLAPGHLIDKRISWVELAPKRVRGTFKNGSVSISAELQFGPEGQLVNFISNDRVEVNEGKRLPFLTPIHGYQTIQGYQLMKDADAVYRYPEEDFVYGQFSLKSIEYKF